MQLLKEDFQDFPLKEDFQEPKTTDEILDKLNISKNEFEHALFMSDEDSFQNHTKGPPNSCFVNSYFSEGLQAWDANIDIRSIFDHRKAVAYTCAYLSK